MDKVASEIRADPLTPSKTLLLQESWVQRSVLPLVASVLSPFGRKQHGCKEQQGQWEAVAICMHLSLFQNCSEGWGETQREELKVDRTAGLQGSRFIEVKSVLWKSFSEDWCDFSRAFVACSFLKLAAVPSMLAHSRKAKQISECGKENNSQCKIK